MATFRKPNTLFHYPSSGEYAAPTEDQRAVFDRLFSIALDRKNPCSPNVYNFFHAWARGDGFGPRDLWNCDTQTANDLLAAMTYLAFNKAGPSHLGYEWEVISRVWNPGYWKKVDAERKQYEESQKNA